MNKIYINQDSYAMLELWAKNHRDYIIGCPAFFKKFVMILNGTGLPDGKIQTICEYKKARKTYKFSVLDDGVFAPKSQIAKGELSVDAFEENDYRISVKIADAIERSEVLDNYLMTVMRSMLSANAFLWFGNIVDNNNLLASGRNNGKDKIIVFRNAGNKIYAVATGTHQSPEGVFGVRGHFRKYKNGKVVWISPYIKGQKEEKNEYFKK